MTQWVVRLAGLYLVISSLQASLGESGPPYPSFVLMVCGAMMFLGSLSPKMRAVGPREVTTPKARLIEGLGASLTLAAVFLALTDYFNPFGWLCSLVGLSLLVYSIRPAR